MEPDIHQPDSLDASTASAHDVRRNPNGEQGDGVVSDAEQFARDWLYAQRALLARWSELTPDDFAAADGDRQRFVERLASRGGVSQFEAANDLTAFEAHLPIRWRRPVPIPLSKK